MTGHRHQYLMIAELVCQKSLVTTAVLAFPVSGKSTPQPSGATTSLTHGAGPITRKRGLTNRDGYFYPTPAATKDAFQTLLLSNSSRSDLTNIGAKALAKKASLDLNGELVAVWPRAYHRGRRNGWPVCFLTSSIIRLTSIGFSSTSMTLSGCSVRN